MAWNRKLLIIIVCVASLQIMYMLFYRLFSTSPPSVSFPVANLSSFSLYTLLPVSKKLKTCPQPHLVGPLAISTTVISLEQLRLKWSPLPISPSASSFIDYGPGNGMGIWRPEKCEPLGVEHNRTSLVAIIIPYRNREANLSVFLNHMHPFLRHQHIAYAIYVIEQNEPFKFNRAALFNVGYREAMQNFNFTCLIFHDVDLLPEDDRNLYACADQPLHLSVAVDKFDYKLLYSTLFGGVIAMTPAHFERVKGFANIYYGWGGEDDDMSLRVTNAGLHISRYPENIARYTMMKHNKEEGNSPNPVRHNALAGAIKNQKTDTFQTLRYRVLSRGPRFNGLFFHVKVDLLFPLPDNSSETINRN